MTTLGTLREAYRTAKIADAAWSDELQRVYGRQAGDARYDARGTATPELARLHAAFRAASDARYAAHTAHIEAAQVEVPR